ncbi:MAG: histidine kinase dimerization/phospho-acceptor domain-containing protein [Rhabdaerophilum sp.]
MELAEPTDPLLDRFVPALVVIFLAVAGLSMLIQFTSTRRDVLTASEDALAVAARMVAAEAIIRHLSGGEPAGAVQAIPTEADLVGRAFLIVGTDQRIMRSSKPDIAPGRALRSLFTSQEDALEPVSRGNMRQLVLADGRPTSVITRDLPNGQILIAFQPIEDELIAWRRHAYIIAALLFAFGAVTIAFSAAFYMQRARARETEQSATRLFNRFEVALDRGNVGLVDARMGDSHVWLSNSMFRLLGLEHGERQVSRADLESLVHADDLSPLTVIEQADPQSGEIDHLFRMRHASRGWLWMHMRAARIAENGRRGRLLGIVMDVTAEREAAAESERADLRLRDAIESISEAFVLWDENNQLLLCNSKYRAFHGLSEADTLRGTRYEALMGNAQEPRLVVEFDRGADDDGRARAYEAQFEDGRWLLINERPTSAGGYVSVGTDITARKAQENRLIENERQLRITIADLASSREALRKQAQELAELADLYRDQKIEALSAVKMKAEFLANMNHEIRTPLNAILGFAEVIENEVLGPVACERYRNYATHIRESGVSLLTIIDDILEMAHIEAGRVQIERSSHTIGDLLEDAATAVALDAATKGVRLEIDPAASELAGSRRIDVDIRATEQALIHLARNAIRLSPYGGTVTMRARMQGEHVNIFISDRGCHLSESDIGKLSKPFGHIDGMLHDGCKGSGLGVAIARGLIELQGGILRIRSAPQLGTLIMVHLPITKTGQAPTPHAAPQSIALTRSAA